MHLDAGCWLPDKCASSSLLSTCSRSHAAHSTNALLCASLWPLQALMSHWLRSWCRRLGMLELQAEQCIAALTYAPSAVGSEKESSPETHLHLLQLWLVALGLGRPPLGRRLCAFVVVGRRPLPGLAAAPVGAAATPWTSACDCKPQLHQLSGEQCGKETHAAPRRLCHRQNGLVKQLHVAQKHHF